MGEQNTEAGTTRFSIKAVKSDVLDDWYTINRVRHDGREWMEKVGQNSQRFMMSKRLSPEACIEGSAEEMITLAAAITRRHSAIFKRCAVRVDGEIAYFHSPKNSDCEVAIAIQDADEFAANVMEQLAPKEPA